jgi:signal recognition particle subunit SEC65
MEVLQHILRGFPIIKLEEMDRTKLMDRVDTKFAFHRDSLPEIIKELKEYFHVLEVEGKRISQYESLYFDKNAFDFYNDHHNNRNHRFKVRFRKYVDSGLNFLEVKEKRKGRMIKRRIPVKKFEHELSDSSKSFVEQLLSDEDKLEPKLWNQYQRITLVNKNLNERLTFDINLEFKWGKEEKKFPSLVIAELKQERKNRNSPFYKLMRSKRIRPYRISKYCIGAIELYDTKNLKYNRFKKKLLKLKKINDAT